MLSRQTMALVASGSRSPTSPAKSAFAKVTAKPLARFFPVCRWPSGIPSERASPDSRYSPRQRADIGRYDFLDCFRLNLELLEPWQAPTRDIVLLEKVNLSGG